MERILLVYRGKNRPSDRESEADDYLQVGYFFLLQELHLMKRT